MINSQDIKKGVAVRMDGGIWVCIDFQHRKPGKGNTIMLQTVVCLSVVTISARNLRMFLSHVAHTSISTKRERTISS